MDFAKEEFLHVRELLIFRSMFPLESVERIIDATNEKLEEGAKTSEAEFWTLLGLIFALSVSPLHEADEHSGNNPTMVYFLAPTLVASCHVTASTTSLVPSAWTNTMRKMKR